MVPQLVLWPWRLPSAKICQVALWWGHWRGLPGSVRARGTRSQTAPNQGSETGQSPVYPGQQGGGQLQECLDCTK